MTTPKILAGIAVLIGLLFVPSSASAHGSVDVNVASTSQAQGEIIGQYRYHTTEPHADVWCYAALYRRPGNGGPGDWVLLTNQGHFTGGGRGCDENTVWVVRRCEKDYYAFGTGESYNANGGTAHHAEDFSSIVQSTC